MFLLVFTYTSSCPIISILFVTLVLPIDWHLSYILSLLSVPTYWYGQPLFSQGSQTGYFESNQFLEGFDFFY